MGTSCLSRIDMILRFVDGTLSSISNSETTSKSRISFQGACYYLVNTKRGTPLLNQETSESGAINFRQRIWMGRKMVKMARITNEKTRITTYRKRKACLYKKANEFSTLCGVNTCLIVYGPSRAGEERINDPELWPVDESKVREIISKYRDTASSSCTKTYTVQECLEKSKTKVAKVKYCPWDKKLDNCSLHELYATFVAVGNKIQEAENRNQTYPDASWSTDQLDLFGYNQQQCLEQHQLFPLSSMEQNGFAFLPFLNQMTSNTGEGASFPNVTEPEMTQAMFYGSCSDGQYAPMVQRTAYMETMQWGLGNSMFNNVKPFATYPLRFGQVTDLENSGKSPM